MEEYLTAAASGPGLYTSTSRDVISAQYSNTAANHHSLPAPPPPAPAPSPNPQSGGSSSPPIYRIPVPDFAVQPTPSPLAQQRSAQSRRKRETFRQSSLRERESRDGGESSGPTRSRSRSSMREGRQYPPKYEDICFDV